MKSFLAILVVLVILGALASVFLLHSSSFSLNIDGAATEAPEKVAETPKMQVYFVPQNIGNNCAEVVIAQRPLLEAADPINAAFEALLVGPNEAEQAQGLTTTIPAGVKINKLEMADRILKVDFSDALSKGVAGACRVTAIRAQITATALQFSNVTSVEIGVNGETEEILQP